ncbi:MAG: aminoglycoside phosphotransferase family protein [Actinobacteria bacterium]|nr:aminoglycoside phosphotransferase family protein [Actinomycetota bacterium]
MSMREPASGPVVGAPYIGAPFGDRESAEDWVADVARQWSLPAPVLVRMSMNAVYRCGDVVLRVGRPVPGAPASRELCDVLRNADIPIAEIIDELDAPDGRRVTAMAYITAGAEVDWVHTGRIVARLHDRVGVDELPDGWPVADPRRLPWWELEQLVGELDTACLDIADDVNERVRARLTHVVDGYRWWRDEVDHDAVICHGDLQPANVLMGSHGPVLIDWDLLAMAPRGWDHGPMLAQTRRWGVPSSVYDQYTRGYGTDLSADRFALAVAELRDVAATVLAVRAAASNPVAVIEARHRYLSWIGESSGPWTAR